MNSVTLLLPELATQRFPEVSTASPEGVLRLPPVKVVTKDVEETAASVPPLNRERLFPVPFATQMYPVPVTASATGPLMPPAAAEVLVGEVPLLRKRVSVLALVLTE